MNSLRIQLSESQQTYTVDNAALQRWGIALLDEILFTAAKTLAENEHGAPVNANLSFNITADPDAGDIVIEA